MRTVIHLSDLHFGRIDEAILMPLIEQINAATPDLVVVSGDLTQRARSAQFIAARQFLDALPHPQIIVPGNHDVPLHNVFDRFVRPLEKFRRYVCDDLTPVYIDDEIAVVGMNTTRSLTIKNGRFDEVHIAHVKNTLNQLGDHITKIIVTHHPFQLRQKYTQDDLVEGAAQAMTLFSQCKIDLLLAGHMHDSATELTSQRYQLPGYSAIAVQAGTATSTRGRGESNSFNILRIASNSIIVERMTWDESISLFVLAVTEEFSRIEETWQQVVK